MKVHVFTGKNRVFGFTDDASGAKLPPRHGPWSAFKEIKIKRGDRPRIAVNSDEALDDIANHGYHLVRIRAVKPS